jgi:small subunit ribosomal protein S6
MNKYEAMFIVKPDLSETDRKTLFTQINDLVAKHSGTITQSSVWSEKRKLCFPVKKHKEGVYYLVNFSALGDVIAKIRHAYNLNENILRVLITRVGA